MFKRLTSIDGRPHSRRPALAPFRSLSARLAFQFALMFAAAMAIISIASTSLAARPGAATTTFQLVVLIVSLASLMGVTMLVWRSANRITQPLVRLDDAASRLARGEQVKVAVRGDDELARLAGSFNDMVEKIAERERRITELAFNDPLTGLPNRAMFQQQLAHAVKAMEGSGTGFALHSLDLDQFKAVNDTLGHPAGDALLREVGARLLKVAQGHFVARLGGDEFVVIQSVGATRSGVEQMAKAVNAVLGEPATIAGKMVTPSTSIGIAIAPHDGADGETLLRNADLALYRVKENGRGSFAFFEEQMNREAQHRRNLEADLRAAIASDEVTLAFQPLFDLKSGRICAFETLARWTCPKRGVVPASEFVPIAEESGLIIALGQLAFDRACAAAVGWPDRIRVAVNISPVHFHRGGLYDSVVRAIARSEIDPSRLEIEVTESVFLGGGDEVLDLMHAIRALGVRIALDDFGTGFSSLSYLQRFPFDKMKIDQSFVRTMLTRHESAAIVAAFARLAQALAIETTAEGVESREQLDRLAELGCTSVQGYLFGEPMSAADVSAALDRGDDDWRAVA